ncbi:MAG TPA: dihydrodipicolinate synthase family protein [Arenicellales bacterium]|nr:dihydrodipicolinate synthase family protein [Arenicellales bacterium]
MPENMPRFSGVWVPALTPFNADLSVNRQAFVTHCRWLLEQGADGLAVFGTTSEANSLSGGERMELLETLVEAGIPGERLMPGVGCCALPDTVRLCRHALEQGCRAVLALPPFYYKGVGDEGLFTYFSAVIDQVGSSELMLFLYHIPPVSQIPLSMDLVARLLESYPRQIGGLKDSGGDWSNTQALLKAFPNLAIFAGSERFLLDTIQNGGAGCITASGNVNPAGIRQVYEHWRGGDSDVEALQKSITSVRDVLERYTMIPALKSICARYYREDGWAVVRPPLQALPADSQAALHRDLDQLGFSMAENRESVLKLAGQED